MGFVVGVTGGIGSGKSAVTNRLAGLGIDIIDADIVARDVVAPGEDTLAAIADHFGSHILQADGTLDRAALRQIVFQDPEQRRWLEGVTHPAIRERMQGQLAAARSPYAVLVSPLLLESEQRMLVNHVVVVDVPPDVQVARASQRDQNSPEQIARIMAAQLPREQRLLGADDVIDNSGTLTVLQQQVDDLHQKLLKLALNSAAQPRYSDSPREN